MCIVYNIDGSSGIGSNWRLYPIGCGTATGGSDIINDEGRVARIFEGEMMFYFSFVLDITELMCGWAQPFDLASGRGDKKADCKTNRQKEAFHKGDYSVLLGIGD